jgi:hypothetical protein
MLTMLIWSPPATPALLGDWRQVAHSAEAAAKWSSGRHHAPPHQHADARSEWQNGFQCKHYKHLTADNLERFRQRAAVGPVRIADSASA